MIIFFFLSLVVIAAGIYGIRNRADHRKGYYFLTGLGILLLIMGLVSFGDGNQEAPYFKIGERVSAIKSNDNTVKHDNYYTVKGRKHVRYYFVTNNNNKEIISAVKFNYYETDNNASHKKLMKDYKKVTASDLKQTSTDHYYSKKEHKHYWSTEETDVDGYSQGIIHLDYQDMN